MAARLVQILETYRGRDKIIRLAAYSCCFVGGVLKNTNLQTLSGSLTILSDNLNECRTVLRLFDDLSMFLHCQRYGVGSEEKDLFIRLSTLVDNICGQAYYVVEKFAWARDKKVLEGNSSKLWVAGILLWLGSLCISIAQSIWQLKMLKEEEEEWRTKFRMAQQGQHPLETGSDEEHHSRTSIQPNIDRQLQEARNVQSHKLWHAAKKRQLLVTLIGSLADAGNAVNWLPGGYLWAGMFNQAVVGCFGTVASVSLLFNYLNPVGSRDENIKNID